MHSLFPPPSTAFVVCAALATSFVLGHGQDAADASDAQGAAPVAGLQADVEALSESQPTTSAQVLSILPPELPEELLTRARDLAARAYQAPADSLPEMLSALDYDHYRLVDFRSSESLWQGAGGFALQFFHRGYLFRDRVELRERTSEACLPIPYRPAMFDFESLAKRIDFDPSKLDENLGFAGFAVYAPTEDPGEFAEVASFLGASYFRLCGWKATWGGSFRGLAIGTGLSGTEEFPCFVEHWIQRPEADEQTLTIYSLLDSPSVAGAYAMRLTPGTQVRADVAAVLLPRRAIEKVGIAPLTSMFFHGENGAHTPDDYRPEVHDSDGLAIATGDGRHLWRPLMNPPLRHRVTRFELESPQGFGLLQRDRDFASYQDLESHFESRPSMWVEPLGDWGPGAVELIEIPTKSEVHDNIVAFWCPAEGLAKDTELRLAYSLVATNEPSGPVRRVLGTRRSRLAERGTRFHVDFSGLPQEPGADAVPSANFARSEARVTPVSVQANPAAGTWRVVFDVLEPPTEDVQITLRLEGPAGAVSEEWITLLLEDGRQ